MKTLNDAAKRLIPTSPLYDKVEVIPVHEHTCCICTHTFACTRENCRIENRYAVCASTICIQEWDSFEDDHDDDDGPHPQHCICLDCSSGDFDMNHEALPSRA